MLRKYIIRDMIGVVLLLAGSFVVGLLLNEIRSAPLPLVYTSPGDRLKQTTQALNSSPTGAVTQEADVDLDKMRKISMNHEALILDARSQKLYRAGHIPWAVNLPQEDFDQRYQALLATLQAHRNQPIVVYCSGFLCPDSQIVAAHLLQHGYQHVRLFPGGWNDWQSANLPAEKE